MSKPKIGTMITIAPALTAGDAELLPPGAVVGEYVLGDLLGVGGFARVYRARHAVLARSVAVKVINRALSLNPEATERFVREALAASRIEHPGVVRVLGYGKLADGRAYQVMELVEGPPLDEHLEASGRPPVEEALRLLDGIASALDAAHAAGIVHRDLKPANILMAPGEAGPVPRLADFGIAKALEPDDNNTQLTRTGTTLGTPVYMSPEQALGRSVGASSDIYSFGVVAFELLTGQVPFDGESALETMMNHVQTTPPAPSDVVPELGTGFDAAIEWLLAKQPDHRPPNLAEAMAALRGGTPGRAPAMARSRRAWRVALALGAVVTLAVVAAVLVEGSATPVPAAPQAAPPSLPASGLQPVPAAVDGAAVYPVTSAPAPAPAPGPKKRDPRPRPAGAKATAAVANPDSLEIPSDYEP